MRLPKRRRRIQRKVPGRKKLRRKRRRLEARLIPKYELAL